MDNELLNQNEESQEHVKGAKLPQTDLMDTAEIAKVPSETAMSIDRDGSAKQLLEQEQDGEQQLGLGGDADEPLLSQKTRLNS